MGIFSYTDPQTKRVYNFEHGGETPTDEDFAFMRQIIDTDRADYAQKYQRFKGEEFVPDDGTAFGRGWDRGVEDVRGSLGELLQTLGQRTGFEGLADYGHGMEQNAVRNLGEMSLTNPAPMSFRDVEGLGSGLTYLGELAGSSAPVMGGILAGTGIAALTAPGWVPAAVGGALVAAPYYAGSIMQEQERNYGEDNVNLATAFGGGAVAAALDAASLGVLGRLGVGKAAIQAMSGEVGRNLTMRLLTGAGAGALTEGTTETLQEVTQLLAAGTDPNSPEVQDRLLEAFVGGGVLGGVIGGAGRGAFGKRPEAPPPPPPATPPAGGPAATPPAAPGPTFAFDDAGQGQLFSDLAEGRAPAPATEIPPNLRRPDTSGLPLFDAADTNNRPAATVLNELGVSPNAPIRKRLASMAEGEPQFLEALKKYAATPGLTKDHRDAVKAYISTREGAGISSVPNPIPTEAGAAATAGAVPKAPKAPKAGTAGTAPTAPRFTGPITAAEFQALPDADKLTYLDEVGLPPVPEAAAAPKPPKAPKAPKATVTPAPTTGTGLQIQGVDEAVANGVSKVKVVEDGKEVPFKNFALSVDGDTAEVGFVERDKSARKGVGYDAYVALGEDLAARGITLQSTETLQAPGRALWEKLAKQGKATFDPATKRFKFGAAPEAAPAPKAAAAPARSSKKYTASTEDAGDVPVQIIRHPDGSATVFTDTSTQDYPAAFAASKSDEDLMAYQLEPIGYKSAAPEVETETKSTPAIWASKDFDIPVEILPEPAQTDPKTGEQYQKVRQQDGNIGFVPVSQLRPVPTAPKPQEPTTRTAADGSTIIALPLPDGTQADVVMHDITSVVEKAAGVTRTPRAIAMREINGVKVPFYLSTGEGGKTDVPSGKWYPFFGLSRAGWFNKSSGRTITEYYFTPELRAAAEALDASVGDIRGSTTTPTVTRGNDAAFVEFINQDLNPAEPNTETAKTNIVETIKRIKQGAPAPEPKFKHPEGAPFTRPLTDEEFETLSDADKARYEADPNMPPTRNMRGIPSEPPSLRRPAPPTLRVPGGPTIVGANQLIPEPGIRPTPGKQLASQQATQRESIARQLSVKNQLEAKMADLRSRIGADKRIPESTRNKAKALGIKAAEYKKTLQRELRRLQAQHYSVMSYLNSEAGKAQAEAEGSTNQENIRRRAENDAARVAYRAWYEANTPTEIQAYDADMRSEGLNVAPVVLPETGVATAVDPKARAQALAQEAAAIDALDPTTVEDKAKLLDLIQKGPRRLPGKINENARAAFAYFSKSRDIADALDIIAADAAMPDIPGKRVSSNRETLHPYWKGTGKDAAMKAAQWVEDNLSEETLAYMDEKIGYYMEDTAEAAGDVIDRQIKNTRANEEADEKTLGEYYKAMSAIDNADVSQELGIESGVFSREKLSRMDARTLGSDRELLNEIGLDIDGFLRLKPASIAFGLEAPLHPTVIKALRAGNLRTALEALSATSSDPYISQLAKSLINFIGDTKVYTTRSGGPNTRAEVKRLLTDDAGTVHPGTYVLMSEANLRESQEVSPKYAAAIQNSILLDEATGMNAHAILHEVLHAATARELMFNPNGPVARRLETLRQQVFDAVAKEFTDRGEEIPYGLKDVREFVSEALTNQEFQGMLDRLYPTTKKVTALEQLIRTLANFVRTRILRKPAKVYDDNKLVPSRLKQGQESVFDEVDRLVRSIFNTAPEFGIYEPLFDTARRPAAAADAFTNMGMRLRIPNATDAIKLDNAVTQAAKLRGTAQTKAMPTILAYLTPSRNLVDLAKQYFPDADRVHENLTKHSQYVSDLHSTVWNTLKDTYKWLDAHPKLEQAFHSLRTRASKQQIDPRLPEKFYNSFVVRYYTYTPDGTIGEPKYEDFPSASEARDFITKINDAEANGAATTKAKLLFTPDKENAALHRKFKMELDALEAQAPGAKAAYSDYLNIAERLHIEAGAALKDRVAAKFPGRENAYTRNMILRNQYNKIFAERGLLAYQPLQREGDIRISYNGVHPDTNTVEPFVHYVDSMETALRAREALLALPPEYKIRESNTVTVDGVSEVVIDIGPRGRPSPYGQRMAVPSTYVTDVVKTLKAAAIKDADAAGRAALAEGKSQAEADAERARVFKLLNDNADANAERIVEMALDALPESSIFSAYRARTGVSGFTGDLSPLKAAFDAIEQPFDAPDVSRGMFEKFVNSMTRKIGAIHQQADADLVRQALNGQLEALGRQLGNTQISPLEYDKARIYHTALTEALNNPSIPRNDLVTAVNTGAYMFTLFGNVSSVVMNIMGAVTFVYPRLAVRYGPVEAAKMMVRSLRVIANSGRTRMEPRIGPDGKIVYEETDAGAAGRSLRNYKFTAVDHSQGFNKGANKINALGYLADVATKRRMLIDSIVRDDIDSHATQSSTFNKLLHWGSAPLHHVERLVRESAMIANYELELRRMATEKGSDVLTEEEMKKAAMFAVQEAEIMTGTVPATTAPSGAQRGIMPMIMMYKRYPLAMMHMIIRDIARSVPSRAKLVEMYGEDTAEFRNALEDRRIARLQVAAVLGSVALFSGAMGMPLYGLIADLYDAFFREDDEESFDTLVRTGIGELGSKGILNYLFGVEFSSRIGLSDILYRSPLRAEDQPPMWNLIEGFGGPAISILSNWSTRSKALFEQGEYYRALESALPATMRNGMRAARFMSDGGAESMRGDIISDIGPGQALAQALGFAPSAYIRQVELNSEAKRIETAIAAKKTRIMRAINMARRNGDSEAYADAMAEKERFDREHPDKRITPEALRQSRRTFARNSEKVRNGIVLSDPQSYDLREIMELADEPASIWDQ